MAAYAMEYDLLEAAKAGMTAQVGKPIDIEELVATLQRLAGGAVAPAAAAQIPAAPPRPFRRG
jgi:CheY-like chemotaxis protein